MIVVALLVADPRARRRYAVALTDAGCRIGGPAGAAVVVAGAGGPYPARSRARLLVVGPADEPALWAALRAGATGYVTPAAAESALATAVVAVAGGRRYLSPDLLDAVIAGLGRRAAPA